MSEALDQLHATGLAAAQAHFDAMVNCMRHVLPESLHGTIPDKMGERGLFSASSKDFSIVILSNTPGYESMNAVFEHRGVGPTASGWRLEKFSVMIGGGGLFSLPKEYTATRIEDALVLSKQIAAYRDKYYAENPAVPSIPDPATSTKPN